MVLAGLRVLDLADEKASFCSKLLSDLGAGVIKRLRSGVETHRGETVLFGGVSLILKGVCPSGTTIPVRKA
jgi:crotonobetainyl-CoA:carnitine CoA-transferase CaiB-like acyl-CoA transferase